MNRIDRYISGLFLLYFAGGLLIFSTIFVSIDALGLMVEYKGLSGATLAAYYGYSIPEIIYRMVPVASVMAVVFALSTLNRSNELVALYSAGMGLFRICTPMLLWILLFCGFEFAIGDRILPNFAKNKNYVFFHQIKKNPSLYSMVKTNKIWYRSKDTIFYIKTLNEKARKAQGLTLYYFNDNWDLLQMISAKEVTFSGENWHLRDGSLTLFTPDSSFPLSSQFKTKTIVMGEDAKDLSSTAHTSDVLNLGELSQFIKKNKEAGLDTVRYEVDYHSKYSYPLAALVMALLGIPFSVGRARSGGVMRNVGICLALIFLFWIFYSSSLTLGNYGHVPPFLAAWFPIVSMSGLSYWFMKKAKL
jgi:lipopolysaccharide export system permease protein